MSYEVLARKWRPKTFSEMVGQEHVLRTLSNALDNNRLHHAYLFTGTRGVGKTTVARILAKALNCETGVSSSPCGQCSACTEIDEGRFVDLIEVDAASRTKVEGTRELLENVQYAPTRGRYKVYLIDEVHMFSAHSFNALLKTLEEPPPHVKFLLATTDPQKLPVTILSRCLQFNLKRLPPDQIAGQLNRILESEHIDNESIAISLLSEAADGSMRDALSLLDQAIAFGGGSVKDEDVRNMLGSIDHQYIVNLLTSLANGNGSEILQVIEELDELSPDYMSVLSELISALQKLAVTQVVGLEDSRQQQDSQYAELAERLSPEDVQLYYQIALMGMRDLPLLANQRSGFEMITLRMLAFRPAVATETISAAPTQPVMTEVKNAEKKTPPQTTSQADDWSAIIQAMNIGGLERELAINSILKERQDHAICLVLDQQHANLHTDKIETRLKNSLENYYQHEISLTVEIAKPDMETPAERQVREDAARHDKAVTSIQGDSTIKALCDAFDASVDPDAVTPID